MATVKKARKIIEESSERIDAVSFNKPAFDGIIKSVKPQEQLRLF